MITYQITDIARITQTRNDEVIERASEILGIDPSQLWEKARENEENELKEDFVLNYMAQEFGDRFYSPPLYHSDITEEKLMHVITKEQIQILIDGDHLEKIDPDEDLLEIIDEAFRGFGKIFDIEYLKSRAPEFSEKAKDRIITEISKGDDDRDYPSFLHIRGIVLQELKVISARRITIKEED